ncbi:MAG: hypothetical protein VB065_12640, partial [Eubacteriales bacterium]|nr:hypothetical protein [Eubacteriales bacterium]
VTDFLVNHQIVDTDTPPEIQSVGTKEISGAVRPLSRIGNHGSYDKPALALPPGEKRLLLLYRISIARAARERQGVGKILHRDGL